MKYWFSLLITVGFGACTLADLSVTEFHVSIRYDVNLDSDEKVQALADEQCASFGRKAVFRRSTKVEGPSSDLRYAHFSCTEASFDRSSQIPGLDGRRRLRD